MRFGMCGAFLPADMDEFTPAIAERIKSLGFSGVYCRFSANDPFATTPAQCHRVRELFREPSHPYTRGLLASVPRLDSRGALTPIAGMPPDLANLPPGCAFAARCPQAHTHCEREPEWVGPTERGARCWGPE